MTWPEFDELYARRHESDALQACENAKFIGFEGKWRAARLWHFTAMQALERGENERALRDFGAGLEAANAAKNQDAGRVEGVFWSVTCELEAARLQSKLSAAKILGRAQRELDRACALDEAFHFAGPLRVLGRLIQLKPLVLGGNLDRAMAFYEHALQLFPRNSTTLIYLADALILDRQPARAKTVLRQILEDSDESNWGWETRRDQKNAQLWLQTRFK